MMNKPKIAPEECANNNVVKCLSCTFVSILIPSAVIRKVGLPIAEYFIWHDDIEFTQRIVSHGYKGYLDNSSIVVHKTPTNYGASIITAPDTAYWRFYYQIRNQMATMRMQRNYLSFLFSSLNKYRLYLRRVSKRTSNQDKFRKEIKRGFIDGLKFKPKIEFVD